ncbi:MAG: hypothetical protein FJ100_15315 [Deltaproteobacteria bacterium]|nr:hypothetical protein [Deltaproteobacteria bacterium]
MWQRLSLLCVLPTAVWAGSAAAADRVPLAEAARRAQLVAVVQMADPGVDQQVVPGTGDGAAAYVRHRFRVQVVQLLRAGRQAPGVGQVILVDRYGWRGDLREHLRCRGKDCRWPEKPALDTQLSREPRAGQRALALLDHTADGWQLALDLGFDRPERAAELAPARGGR